MGLFDFFKKKNEPQMTLKDLIIVDYKPVYKNECEYIREHYVPEKGASEVLQGELLREIELLRKEAKENGNKNWDMDFSYICENIKWKLCNMSIYSEEECLKVNLIIDYLKYTETDVVETNMQVIDQHIRERRSKEYAKKNHS